MGWSGMRWDDHLEPLKNEQAEQAPHSHQPSHPAPLTTPSRVATQCTYLGAGDLDGLFLEFLPLVVLPRPLSRPLSRSRSRSLPRGFPSDGIGTASRACPQRPRWFGLGYCVTHSLTRERTLLPTPRLLTSSLAGGSTPGDPTRVPRRFRATILPLLPNATGAVSWWSTVDRRSSNRQQQYRWSTRAQPSCATGMALHGRV